MPLTILIVEPEEALRETVRAALKEAGHHLWAFGTAARALEGMDEQAADLALLPADEDAAVEPLVDHLRRAGPRCQLVWIAPPGGSEVERLVAARHPRGLLPRSDLAEAAVRLASRVEQSRERSRALQGAPAMWGESPAMTAVSELLRKIAAGAAPTVLVTGESGTGKEVAARTIHAWGPRGGGPFVEVDCAAIPGSLMESELFGYEAGTFTDAGDSRTGLLELAQGGTVFLDEIGEMEFPLQSKLLRVLDSRRLRRLGSTRETPLDVHLVAATNRDLAEEVRRGHFRADLYYRLDVVRVELPPLRMCGRDAVLLAERFLEAACRKLGRDPLHLGPGAETELLAYAWPGNVRELRNQIDRLALLTDPAVDRLESLGLALSPRSKGRVSVDFSGGPVPWEEIERRVLVEALQVAAGNVSEAARLLGLGRGALRYRLARHGMGGDETPVQEDRDRRAA